MTTNTTPSVYVGTYAKYNNGDITGEWFELDDYNNEDEFIEACLAFHCDESDPELMFQDYEGFPSEFYGESGLDAGLWDWLALDDNERDILAAFVAAFGQTPDDVQTALDACQGQYDSELDYAIELVDDSCNLGGPLAQYFDYEKFARDLFIDGYTFSNGYVFSDNW